MEDTTELLILADGRVLVHNMTPTMAALLSDLNPHDELMRERARVGKEREAETNCKALP